MKTLAIASATLLLTGCMTTAVEQQTQTAALHQGGVIVVSAASAPKACLKNDKTYSFYGNPGVMRNTNRYNQCRN